jgi:quercetin dioxygenase-like cupin family protein
VKIVRFDEAERYEPEKDWKRVSLCGECDISVEHFVKPPGHSSPDHSHPNSQVLVVLEGKLVIVTANGGEQELSTGDAAYIPGDEMHIVKNPLDVPSKGIDIFVPGRDFDFWLKRGKKACEEK